MREYIERERTENTTICTFCFKSILSDVTEQLFELFREKEGIIFLIIHIQIHSTDYIRYYLRNSPFVLLSVVSLHCLARYINLLSNIVSNISQKECNPFRV